MSAADVAKLWSSASSKVKCPCGVQRSIKKCVAIQSVIVDTITNISYLDSILLLAWNENVTSDRNKYILLATLIAVYIYSSFFQTILIWKKYHNFKYCLISLCGFGIIPMMKHDYDKYDENHELFMQLVKYKWIKSSKIALPMGTLQPLIIIVNRPPSSASDYDYPYLGPLVSSIIAIFSYALSVKNYWYYKDHIFITNNNEGQYASILDKKKFLSKISCFIFGDIVFRILFHGTLFTLLICGYTTTSDESFEIVDCWENGYILLIYIASIFIHQCWNQINIHKCIVYQIEHKYLDTGYCYDRVAKFIRGFIAGFYGLICCVISPSLIIIVKYLNISLISRWIFRCNYCGLCVCYAVNSFVFIAGIGYFSGLEDEIDEMDVFSLYLWSIAMPLSACFCYCLMVPICSGYQLYTYSKKIEKQIYLEKLNNENDVDEVDEGEAENDVSMVSVAIEGNVRNASSGDVGIGNRSKDSLTSNFVNRDSYQTF